MYQMREKWTDERLDDLKDRVDDGFHRVDDRFAHMDQRFDTLQKLLVQMAMLMLTGFIGLATLILAQG
jgi:hypothetical protein